MESFLETLLGKLAAIIWWWWWWSGWTYLIFGWQGFLRSGVKSDQTRSMLERGYAMGTGSSSVFQSTLLNVMMPASFLAVTWVRLEVKREGEGTNKAEGGGGEAWILGQGCLATGAPLKHPAAPLLHPRYLPPVFPSATCHVFLLHLLLPTSTILRIGSRLLQQQPATFQPLIFYLLSSLNAPTLQSLIYNHWQKEHHKQLTASE